MKKTTAIIIAALVVLFGGFTIYTINTRNAKKDTSGYDEWSFVEANEANGQMADNYIGNTDAKVKIIEWADYQCPGCATTFPYIHSIVKEYGDKVLYIYRSYVLSYHPNGNAAASAANAAAKQGYWEEYATLIFDRQIEWEELTGSNRDKAWVEYFKEVTDNKGDIDKFKSDMSSSSVKNKIAFDRNLAKHVDIQSTPAIYVNGKHMEMTVENSTEEGFKNGLKKLIDKALEKTEKE